MVEYNYDAEYYMYGCCQYFAIAFVELFGGQVCLWLDEVYDDKGKEHSVLCHAYTKLAPKLFVDANGIFKDISEREDEFELNSQRIIQGSVKEMKSVLKELRVPYTNIELKQNVREFLRNNLLTFLIEEEGTKYPLGLVGRSNKGELLFVDYKSGHFSNVIHSFSSNILNEKIRGTKGFQPNPQWYYKRK